VRLSSASTRNGSSTAGNGFNSTARDQLNTVVLAAIPMPMVRTTVSVNVDARRN
jgi:hypothetical protein